jgi:phosphate transport system permease protein
MEDQVVRNRAISAAREAGAAFPLGELEHSLRRPRTVFSVFLTALTTLLTLAALVPLFSVVYMVSVRGIHKLSLSVFTSLPPAALEEGGGFGNAILGTLIMVGIATLISVPLGIVAAIFLAEVGPRTWLAQAVRFGAKILSGFPSILAGVFAYGAVVLVTGGFSAVAGGIALAILMLPTVMLTAEDAISMVPAKVREAAIAMGATPTQVIWYVMLPTALPGILTGVMLAIARAAGETAPLLFTALFSNFWPDALMERTASLAVLIYNFSGMPFENQIEMAWAAALVLMLLVLTTNLIGQYFSRRSGQQYQQ